MEAEEPLDPPLNGTLDVVTLFGGPRDGDSLTVEHGQQFLFVAAPRMSAQEFLRSYEGPTPRTAAEFTTVDLTEHVYARDINTPWRFIYKGERAMA